MTGRDFHLNRLKNGLGRIPELAQRDPLRDDPDFDAWRADMIHSLNAVLPGSPYSGRLANTSFRDHAGSYNYDYVPNHAQYRANGLRAAELILSNAIEEAQAAPAPLASKTAASSKQGSMGHIVVNVTNVLSQSVHVEMAQILRAIETADLDPGEQEKAKALATELDAEIRGQQRWPILAKSLDGLRKIGKGLYEKIAIPLLLELLKKQSGL